MTALRAMSIFAVLALAVLAAGPARASHNYISFHGGANYTHDGDVGGAGDLSYDRGWVGGLTYGGYLPGGFRVEGEVTARINEIDRFQGVPVAEGEYVNSLATMLNVFYDIDTGTLLTPYFGAGLGAASVVFEGTSFYAESEEVVAFQAGAGLAVEFLPNLAITVDYRFFITEDPHFDAGGTGFDLEYANSSIWVGLRATF